MNGKEEIKMTRHEMKLDPAYFARIASGRKKYELRLNDDKRRKIEIGDEILFTNNATGQTLLTKVLGKEIFPDFAALYRALPLLECGYTEETLPAASPKDMEAYYSPAEQRKFGVVGIRLELL